MSQSILRKRKVKDLICNSQFLANPNLLYCKKSQELCGQTRIDYSIIINQIQKKYPQITKEHIREILSKNEYDISRVMNQVHQYIENNKQRSVSISDEDWEQKSDIYSLEYLIANPSIQNMRKFFEEVQKEVKTKSNENESQTFRKTHAANFILKEAVKFQKMDLQDVVIKEKNRLEELDKLENQIQQTKLRNKILKEQIDSLKNQPQLIL